MPGSALSFRTLLRFSLIALLINVPDLLRAAPVLSLNTRMDASELRRYELFMDESVRDLVLLRDPTSVRRRIFTVELIDGTTDTLRVHVSLVDALNELLEQLNHDDSSGIACELELTRMEALAGMLTRWEGRTVTLQTPYGSLSVPIDEIKRFTGMVTAKRDGGQVVREDPNTTRLFFAPTGRSLKKGDGYFSVYEVVFPNVNYGIGGKITIGGGFLPFSTSDFFLAWITPKIGIFETKTKSFSLGTLSFLAKDDSTTNNINVLYGVGTWGTPDAALTLGLGYGFENGRFSDRPVAVLGGEYRIGRNTKLISENWLPPDIMEGSALENIIFSVGIRWFGRRISADFALLHTAEMDFLGVPWVDFVINF